MMDIYASTQNDERRMSLSATDGAPSHPAREMRAEGLAVQPRQSPEEQQVVRNPNEGSSLRQACSVLTPVRFEHFNLAERVDETPHPAMPPGSGLAVVSPGRIRCTVGPQTEWVNLVAEIHDETPPDATEDYEDVVERSFYCASGTLSVLDWKLTLVHVLPSLGEGAYRLRYHLRNMDESDGQSDGSPRNVGESLIQIWPAQPTSASELKITSHAGRFWHPFTNFLKPRPENN